MKSSLRIALIEPYHGASHAYFLKNLQAHSRHQLELFALPPRMWKWRVRGAALELARRVNARPAFDAFLCSDFVNVADFRALLQPQYRHVPVLYYLHENQMTYPLSPREVFDPYFGFTNVISCLSAEAVAFNSEFHRREFLNQLPTFLPRLPDYDPQWVVETIKDKASILPVGLNIAELDHIAKQTQRGDRQPPRILWNHRWEFDKDPERFFRTLITLHEQGVEFRLSVVGESFNRHPKVFDEMSVVLASHLDHFGFVDSRADYIQLLCNSDIVVSTAKQEFFGIAMAEAVWCGAFPIAPRSLVYVDFYGGPGSDSRLYRDDAEFMRLLRNALTANPETWKRQEKQIQVLRDRLQNFDIQNVKLQFDQQMEDLRAH